MATDISLPADEIMQKYLVRRIYREIELRLVEMDGTAHVGFITGMDERCIQLSTSPILPQDEPRSILLFWPLRRIEETGNRIDSLAPDFRTKIRSANSVLREQCEKILRNNGALNGHRKPSR